MKTKNQHLAPQFFLLLAIILAVGCSKNKCDLATVKTISATGIQASMTAVCKGEVTNDGGGTVIERGICYRQGSGTPDIKGPHVAGGLGVGVYYCSLKELSVGTYSYRAYATNEAGTAYGDIFSFSINANGNVVDDPTNPSNPDDPSDPDDPADPNMVDEAIVLTIGDVTDVTYNSVKLHGTAYFGKDIIDKITAIGFAMWDRSLENSDDYPVYGFEWKREEKPEQFKSGTTDYEFDISANYKFIQPNTTYGCVMYCKDNNAKYYYSEYMVSFKTPQDPNNPLNDILGTYSMTAKYGSFFNYEDEVDVYWDDICISPYTPYGDTGVKITGLYQGDSDYQAFGTYNKTSKILTLKTTTNEELPSFYYDGTKCMNKFTIYEWGMCGECGVWSGSYLPLGREEAAEFVLNSEGQLQQGKSKVPELNATWVFKFEYYDVSTNQYVGGTSDIKNVVLSKTSASYKPQKNGLIIHNDNSLCHKNVKLWFYQK